MDEIDLDANRRADHVTPGMSKCPLRSLTEQWESTLDAHLGHYASRRLCTHWTISFACVGDQTSWQSLNGERSLCPLAVAAEAHSFPDALRDKASPAQSFLRGDCGECRVMAPTDLTQ
jgi:hypothetical protein